MPYPPQLWPGLHWGDQTETGEQTEGTLRCLQERDDGEFSCGGVCVENHHPINWEETSVLGRARGKGELQHEVGTEHTDYNRDRGWEIPGCWEDMMGEAIVTNL